MNLSACDPAGPMFNLYEKGKNARKAAKNVQCIHTSIDLGTTLRTCHQDFLMGLIENFSPNLFHFENFFLLM
jgi:hypothetical protein